MESVYSKIKFKIRKLPKGSVFSTKDFLDIASRASVDKALSSLVKKGVLKRLHAGIYHYPLDDPTLGIMPPDPDLVIDAIKRKTGHLLQVDGAKAANLLGLSTQVPAKTLYYTDGHTRDVKIGPWSIKLKHACPKILAGAGQKAGYVLQALRYLGKHNATPSIFQKINTVLTKKDKQQLRKILPSSPIWAYNSLLKITKSN